MRSAVLLLEDLSLCREESRQLRNRVGFRDPWHVDEADKLHESLLQEGRM